MDMKPLPLICLAVVAGTSLTLNGMSTAALTETNTPSQPAAAHLSGRSAELLVTGLQGASGSTVGPDGALYVTEGAVGRISRVDPKTGVVTTFATGLPPAVVPGLGGAIDVAFLGKTAYALVTLVGPDVMGSSVVGIYRVNGPNSVTPVADLGAFSIANPPAMMPDVPSGLQYALESYRGGFLVTDGHHNRVLWASTSGRVIEVIAFGNIVPTGLEVSGGLVLMAQAGPVPHLPEDGKVVGLLPGWPFVFEVASGARLLVDVEFGPGHRLYALSQGEFPDGGEPAEPALPDTGALVKVNLNRTFTVVTDGLNQPTSLDFIGNTAYIVTLSGEIWTIHLGRRH